MKSADFIIEINKVHVFKQHSILILLEGQGLFQIDFRNYSFSAGKALFIAPGQYFQLLAGQFTIRVIELPVEKVSETFNSRYLFKHLVSLGYVDLTGEKQFHLDPLWHLDVSGSSPEILHSAIDHWVKQNPFNASHHEVNLLFDLKEIVDEKYREPVSWPFISKALDEKPYRIQVVIREKLKTTVNKLVSRRLLLEAQRKIIFTDQTTKEVAYQLGFSDPT